MDLIKKIKKMLESKNRKKLIQDAFIVVIIGVIIIIAGKSFFPGKEVDDKKTQTDNTTVAANSDISSNTGYSETEVKLRSILTQISGAGKVDVMVTYSVSKENVPAYDVKKSESNTEEKDSGGGTRKIDQNSYESSIVYENSQNGSKNPVIIKELEPVVKGVLVVAEGASNPEVKEKICKAVQVLMDVPIHKIQVVERKK
jgi:hypothetical protein